MKKLLLITVFAVAALSVRSQVFFDGSFNSKLVPGLSASQPDFGLQVYNLSFGCTFNTKVKGLSFDLVPVRLASVRNETGWEHSLNFAANFRWYIPQGLFKRSKK